MIPWLKFQLLDTWKPSPCFFNFRDITCDIITFVNLCMFFRYMEASTCLANPIFLSWKAKQSKQNHYYSPIFTHTHWGSQESRHASHANEHWESQNNVTSTGNDPLCVVNTHRILLVFHAWMTNHHCLQRNLNGFLLRSLYSSHRDIIFTTVSNVSHSSERDLHILWNSRWRTVLRACLGRPWYLLDCW